MAALLAAFPEGAAPLLVGTALALGALSLVLAPLIREEGEALPAPAPPEPPVGTPDPASAVAALREIEFDRATGKLSDDDYADLKARYTRAALAELREADARSTRDPLPATASRATAPADAGASVTDPVEAAIRRARANQRECVVCGPCAEPDALYCSSCGRYLPGACAQCGHEVTLVGSRFCGGCGHQLAAA
ncbi:MAG: hypothetical protein KJT01_06400 [Gemmatimonadetes bacterium]|nr:hypothetical protein [Gemmatimonadota bacterium]